MDDRRFDQLTKALSGSTGSRRETLGLAVGGAAAAVLGFLGVEEAAIAQRRDNNDKRRRRRRNRDNDQDRPQQFCHCPDATGNNCRTKKLKAKKVDRHLKKHPNDYRGKCGRPAAACTDTNVPCDTRTSLCCAGVCCPDRTSPNGIGICPPRDATCCGEQTGGYCTSSFPNCCGSEGCCKSGERCCADINAPRGYCCPAGTTCDIGKGNCVAAQTAAQVASESVAGIFRPRRRTGA